MLNGRHDDNTRQVCETDGNVEMLDRHHDDRDWGLCTEDRLRLGVGRDGKGNLIIWSSCLLKHI